MNKTADSAHLLILKISQVKILSGQFTEVTDINSVHLFHLFPTNAYM